LDHLKSRSKKVKFVDINLNVEAQSKVLHKSKAGTIIFPKKTEGTNPNKDVKAQAAEVYGSKCNRRQVLDGQ